VNYRALFKSLRGEMWRTALELFDIRRDYWKVEPKDGWKVVWEMFTQGGFGGSVIKLGVVGILEGGISISVTLGDGDIADSLIESSTSEFERELIRYIDVSKD
jgi:hypothetical protein